MLISDWSSDVCSSDLRVEAHHLGDDDEGHVDGEVLDEVDLAAGRDVVDDLVGELADVIGERSHLGRREAPAHEAALAGVLRRSEARRVGKECGSTWRTRWSPYN